MKFEYLPNEILLDLFEYFDGIQLIRTFYNLNIRFNKLIQIYSIDFRTISKIDFNLICQRYLPSIINHIKSLHLSEDDETPNLPKSLLLTHNFPLNQFENLQTLTLHCFYSFDILNEIIIQCSYLSSFIRLILIDCYLFNTIKDLYNLINNIWKLSKLIYLKILNSQLLNIHFTKLSIISQTLQILSIENLTCDYSDLTHLIKQTPNLKQLSLGVEYMFEHEQIEVNLSSIIKLKLFYKGCITSIIDLFNKLSNLISLKLETWYIYMNGNQWETILCNYLPKLKYFHLKMNFNFSYKISFEKQVDELLETFQTLFWLKKYKKFVRCNWDSLNQDNSAILYTLPYAFEHFIYSFKSSSKSTCLNEMKFQLYNHVKYLEQFEEINLFPKIKYLKIRLLNFNIENLILNELISIELILLNQEFSYLQLQILFNQSPKLYSVKICYSIDFKIKQLQMINSSTIRRLDFMEKSIFNFQYFNKIDCFHLINSSLGQQCEVLSIGIENRNQIFQFFNTMVNLRAFIFRSKDDKWNYEQSSAINDELIQWLKDHLPSTYTISRKNIGLPVIQIWIS